MSVLIKDDMLFEPYITMGGYQCKMPTGRGTISVRYDGYGLSATPERPYEVWYPTEDAPIGNQTADDIWKYVNDGISEID